MPIEPMYRWTSDGYEGYETAQVCRNGHVCNTRFHTAPEHNEVYCSQCGAPTIVQCERCQHQIKGMLFGCIVVGAEEPPAFCPNCGGPHPWTAQALESAKAVITEEMQLSLADQETLTAAIDELVRDTPKTPVAAMKYRRLVAKAAAGSGEVLKGILSGVIVEGAKRLIWAPGP